MEKVIVLGGHPITGLAAALSEHGHSGGLVVVDVEQFEDRLRKLPDNLRNLVVSGAIHANQAERFFEENKRDIDWDWRNAIETVLHASAMKKMDCREMEQLVADPKRVVVEPKQIDKIPFPKKGKQRRW